MKGSDVMFHQDFPIEEAIKHTSNLTTRRVGLMRSQEMINLTFLLLVATKENSEIQVPEAMLKSIEDRVSKICNMHPAVMFTIFQNIRFQMTQGRDVVGSWVKSLAKTPYTPGTQLSCYERTEKDDIVQRHGKIVDISFTEHYNKCVANYGRYSTENVNNFYLPDSLSTSDMLEIIEPMRHPHVSKVTLEREGHPNITIENPTDVTVVYDISPGFRATFTPSKLSSLNSSHS